MSSTVRALELGRRLRQHRSKLHISSDVAGKRTGIGGNNLLVIENAKRRLAPNKLRALAKLYEISADELTLLEDLHQLAGERGWWDEYASYYSVDFLRYLGLEAGASALREYAAETVPGLLQTEAYAKAMIRGGSVYIKPLDVEPRVESRLARQAVLTADDGPEYTVVIAEAALRNRVGSAEIMGAQLDQLLLMARKYRDRIRIHVMPFEAGAHPLTGGGVKILSFASPLLTDMVWIEAVTTGSLLDRKQVVRELTVSFEEVVERALDVDTSIERIEGVRDEMEAR